MGLHTSSPARLDAEQVVQHGDDEVVMEIAIAVADHERDDRQPSASQMEFSMKLSARPDAV